ncbi:TetR family transcriptional regulator [Flagellimonas sp. DF-77]|uniref:TetR/AcrR family transcriptional regulator n=1 Tax=Flagellimonas algarum TaxID=3230298 RepID=UPI003391539D
MTAKKERIVAAALELFAEYGFNGTSTMKIAKKAQVSEGLIFKHFKNKQGLLAHLITELEAKIESNFGSILNETDPKTVLRKSIESIFNVPKSEYDSWRLQYLLKMDKRYFVPDQNRPYVEHAEVAFKALGYAHPEQEAILFYEILDGLFLSLIRNTISNRKHFRTFLLGKYQL